MIWPALRAEDFLLAQIVPYFLELERKPVLSVAGQVDALMDQLTQLIAPVINWLR